MSKTPFRNLYINWVRFSLSILCIIPFLVFSSSLSGLESHLLFCTSLILMALSFTGYPDEEEEEEEGKEEEEEEEDAN